MVKHIVLFKIREKKDIQPAIEALTEMKGKIENMLDIEVGRDFLMSERSYDIALTCTFTNRAALDAYQSHPVHIPVKQLMAKIRESSVSCDYEF